jgi:hypothetical protein
VEAPFWFCALGASGPDLVLGRVADVDVVSV